MTYCISIDWLAIFCLYEGKPTTGEPEPAQLTWAPVEGGHTMDIDSVYPWHVKQEPYGTRQFSRLYRVSIPNEQAGWDEFCEVQAVPYSKIIHKDAVIVRFVNRALYMPNFWDLADTFLRDNRLTFQSISRIDICADFNQFATIDPRKLIEDFAGKRLRHVGRGVGALYFNHGIMHDKLTGEKDYSVKYNGLSFGTHTSDSRVYLYNKSFELLTQGEKPWIRDIWARYGLKQDEVWRLEVSIKGKGCKFKCKQSGKKVTIDFHNVRPGVPAIDEDTTQGDEVAKIYHTFVARLFAFVRNRRGITNISREPRITLFDGNYHYIRGVIRNKTGASRTEKIVIKALYLLGDKYRGEDVHDMGGIGQSFAFALADSCDLSEWLANKTQEWEKPIHK